MVTKKLKQRKQEPYKYRFCLHLPTTDNNSQLIPRENIEAAFNEIEKKFGGYTTSNYIGFPSWIGYWVDPRDGIAYPDYIYIIYVDVEETKCKDALKFLNNSEKNTWKYLTNMKYT